MNYCFLFLTQLCYKSPSWHENPYAVAPGSWWGHRWEWAGSSLPSGVGGLYLLGGGFNKRIHFKGDTVFSALFLKCFQTYSQLKILRTKKRRHLSGIPIHSHCRRAWFIFAPPTGSQLWNAQYKRFGRMPYLHAFSPKMWHVLFPSHPKPVCSIFIIKGLLHPLKLTDLWKVMERVNYKAGLFLFQWVSVCGMCKAADLSLLKEIKSNIF